MNNIYVDMVGDLFHINHINLIKEAKKFGKYLIVGVHSDSDVESYKYTRLNEALRSVDMIGYGPLRGSLAMAILVAIDYFKADTVNIFGLDFYELDYLVTHNYNYENEKTQCKAIKEDFTTLFNHFKDIQFNVFTLANFEPNLDNVTVS